MNINITSKQCPYFHLITMDESDFCDLGYELAKNHPNFSIKKIRGNKCRTLEALFDEFGAALQFPYYFGENLNAFDECINDLEWLHGEGYCLLISNAENFLEFDETLFEAVVQTIQDAAQEWGSGRDHGMLSTPPTPFHIIFQCGSKEDTESLLEKLSQANIQDVEVF